MKCPGRQGGTAQTRVCGLWPVQGEARDIYFGMRCPPINAQEQHAEGKGPRFILRSPTDAKFLHYLGQLGVVVYLHVHYARSLLLLVKPCKTSYLTLICQGQKVTTIYIYVSIDFLLNI